ncbi:hypothetical protein ACQPVA_07210 [Clostridium butyricum]|uniref:hypothetical protein n=1 Tax=Clostridium butyricum TaxID=1492 RepID=UPI003D34FCA6
MYAIGIEINEYKKLCETVTKVKSVLKDDSCSEHEKLQIINKCVDILEQNLY